MALSRLFNFLVPQSLSNLVSFDKITQKTLAFTFAETLIVMGIIGIVSALTLPNLNSSTGDKEQVAKVKKIYQNLDDAFRRLEAVYGPLDTWYYDHDDEVRQKRFADRLTEFMKISKTCGTNATGCFSSSPYYLFDGTEEDSSTAIHMSGWSGGSHSYILADGTSISIWCPSIIYVDIDGPNKGKNRYGYDIHEFTAEKVDGSYSIYPGTTSNSALYTGAFSSKTYPTAWVIMNENMDYKKCASELNWQTKTSCK